MTSPDTHDHSALPERSFPRYRPRFDPSDYPRHQYGSTLVDDLADDQVSGSRERLLQAEPGEMQSRLARVNKELFDLRAELQQGGAPRSVKTPQPRRRGAPAITFSVDGIGERVARTRPTGSSPRHASPLRPSDARTVRISSSQAKAADQRGGSPNQSAGRVAMEQQMAANGPQGRSRPTAEPTAPEIEPKDEPHQEPIGTGGSGLDAAVQELPSPVSLVDLVARLHPHAVRLRLLRVPLERHRGHSLGPS